MTPKVSVIIPTYNYGRFIAEAIGGVLEQTHPAAEIIVVDDGSSDDTEAVVRGFGDQVRYIKQENAGVCAARNNGVANASGEYFAFVDADDIWQAESIEKQIAVFAADDSIGLVHYGRRDFDSGSGETLGFQLHGDEGWVADDLLLWEQAVIPGPGAVTVKREAFEKVGGFDVDIKVGEDWDFCYRVAREYKVGFVAEALIDYRYHGSNSHKNVAEMERGMSRFYEKAFAAGDADVQKLRNRAYGNFHRVLAGSYYYSGQYGNFLRNAAKSFWYRPSTFAYFAAYPLRRLKRR